MAAGGVAPRRPTIWEIPDDLWLLVQHVLPREELQRSRGRQASGTGPDNNDIVVHSRRYLSNFNDARLTDPN